MGNACHCVRTRTIAVATVKGSVLIGIVIKSASCALRIGVQNARINQFPIFFCLDGKKSKTGRTFFVGCPEKLKIRKSAVAEKADASCSDTSERKGYFMGLGAAVCNVFHCFSLFFLHYRMLDVDFFGL